MPLDCRSPCDSSRSILKSTLITPIEVPTPPNPASAWHTFGEIHYSAIPSPLSPFVGSPVEQASSPRLAPSFQGEFLTMDSSVHDGTFDPIRHRNSFSSSSASSFSDPASPTGLTLSNSPTKNTSFPADAGAEGDDAPWNLIAYHIPWGSAYDGYHAGTLPGPEGTCIFLRSPTPTKRQRTSQACEKCRERKAKCSGARPSCLRCQTRGHICVYSVPLSTDTQSSSSRSSRSPAYSRPERLKLKGSTLNRLRRKSSLAGSESSFGSPSLGDTSPGTEDDFQVTVSADDLYECDDTRLRVRHSQDALGVHPLSPLEPPPSASSTSSFAHSVDALSPPPVFSSLYRARGHTFSSGTAPPLYTTEPGSGLNGFRFPPLDPAKEVPIAHPQPQTIRCRASMPQLSYTLTPVEGTTDVSKAAWYGCDGLEAVWEGAAPAANGGGLELEFPEPSSATSTGSLLLTPASYGSSFEHAHAYSHQAFGVSSEAPFSPPDFQQLEFPEPYGGVDGGANISAYAVWPHDKTQERPELHQGLTGPEGY